MTIILNILTELILGIVWPAVVLVLLLRYEQPLSKFIAELGQRVTKLSAFEVSVELAALPVSPSPWTDPNISKSAEMRGGEVDSTTLMILFDRIKTEERSAYLIVDVKDGHFWFVSRLFIFSVFLWTMRDLKCVVFVQSSLFHRQCLLGVASPDALCSSLKQGFPWMERALNNAIAQYPPSFLAPELPSHTAGNMVRAFIEDRDMRVQVDPNELAKTPARSSASGAQLPTDPIKSNEWLQLGEQHIWEHTHWLDFEISPVSEAVTKSFYEHDSSHYMETQDGFSEERIRQLLARKAPYIAVVNSQNEFMYLLDRQKLAALVGEAAVKHQKM